MARSGIRRGRRLAPMIGGALVANCGWRSIFVLLAALGCVACGGQLARVAGWRYRFFVGGIASCILAACCSPGWPWRSG
jgi:hypothetical protein